MIYTKIGDGKNIIFLSGWKEERETWIQAIEYLKDEFTSWLLDLPGFGENLKIDSVKNPMEYALWLKSFISNENITEYYLCGHSFGGRIGISLASIDHERCKKLVLYGTPGFREKISAPKKIILSLYRTFGLGSLADDRESRIVKAIQNYLRSKDYKDADGLKDIFLASIQYNLEDDMKKIRVPTLIIHGERDEIVPFRTAQKMQDIIRGSTLIVVPRGGHFLHLDNPLLFSGYLKKFFHEENNF